MKVLGLIGGTSWVSTVIYYRFINEMVNERLGRLNSAKLILHSLNYEEVQPPPDVSEWQKLTDIFIVAAKKLEQAGAACIVMCANTPHLIAGKISAQVAIPIIHIVEAVTEEIKRQGTGRVALLGTRFTMEQGFFRDVLTANGIETVIPTEDDRDFIHKSIFDELGKGILKEETKLRYLEIIRKLEQDGAKGVIFGCTEIPMLIKQSECGPIIFDTTLIHAKAAVDFALS
jgi:aspartate racemase